MIVWKIITGPIDSGKTTFAEMYLTTCTNIEGIICHKEQDLRFLRLIGDSQVYSLDTADSPSTEGHNPLHVGRYTFDRSVFQLAKAHLSDLINKEFQTLMIDEIGKLELAGDGYEPELSMLLSHLMLSPKKIDIIVIVRDYLLIDFLEKYKINEYEKLR